MGFFLFFLFTFWNFVYASDRPDRDDRIERLSVIGQREGLASQPGSSHIVTEEELKKFGFNDIHRVLRQVPSVHVQNEEGFGLRPNIGLRSVHPHRSRKITLMEDGVPIAPAPYSAPAAYYFPLLDRMDSIEVFKGVPSTLFGPNSIGGALNLVTKTNDPGANLSLALGSYNFAKYGLSAGFHLIGQFSLDYNRIETTGFKKLKNKSNTGFIRNNFSFRWDHSIKKLNQSLTFKFNWSDENSNETYTGLTRDDFSQDPLKRYRGTELDEMNWNHRQFFFNHSFEAFTGFNVQTSLYRHRLDRSWFKLNGFFDRSVNLRGILRNSHLFANNHFYKVLRGDRDSMILSDNRDVLDLGNNQRQYLSQGGQINMDYDFSHYGTDHLLYFGYRYHQDSVDRFHKSSYYNMKSGSLKQNALLDPETTVLNKSSATAQTLFFNWEIVWEELSLFFMGRYEDILYGQKNFLNRSLSQVDNPNPVQTEQGGLSAPLSLGKDHFFAPGLGFFHQTFSSLAFLAGVSRGFTPRGAMQGIGTELESAVNYELGLRYSHFLSFELISFFVDYENISNTCSQSGGCNIKDLDQIFNGGKAQAFGLDFLLNTDLNFKSFNIPIDLAVTFTEAEFKNSFQTHFPEWGVGSVFSGDPLPYLPQWRSNLSLGLEWGDFSGYLNFNYRDQMADQSVAFGLDSVNREFIKARLLTGLSMIYKISKNIKIRFRIDNLTDEFYEVSQKPFGLRPGRPRFFLVGVNFDCL